MDQLFIMEWISMKNLIKRFEFITTIFHPPINPGTRELMALESDYSVNNSQKERIEWPDWKLQ